jgi:hypothetical protein
MRVAHAVLLAAGALVVLASPALAQRGPVIVSPGKAGVPVYINGIDASWAVVEGEFGLDHAGSVPTTVIYRPVLVTMPAKPKDFYPQSGTRPGYGRLEIPPPADRVLPTPAPTYYRSWTSGSASGSATDYAPYAPPTVIVSPHYGQHNKTSEGKAKP